MCDLSKIKICFLAGTLGQGGAERQLFYALRALRRSGALLRVFCLDRGAFWEDSIRQLGIEVTWVGQHRSKLKRLFRVIRELKSDPPDFVQSQHFYTNVYACAAAAVLGLKGIGALRSNGVFDLRESGRTGGWLNLRLPRTLAANSLAAIRHASRQGVRASRLFFLPNVVDTERFKPGSTPLNTPLTLLTVGRFTREKRFDRFLSILAQLRHVHRLDIRGLLVGPTRADQELKPQLEQMAADLGLLPDGVEFRGSTAELPPVYQKSAAYVLTSDFEGTPNVLLEAMASGVPVVATRVGGVPEIVADGQTGFLFAPEDVNGQVTALARLIQDLQLRTAMGARGRDYVEQHHSVHRLPGYLSRLYSVALGERPTEVTEVSSIAPGRNSALTPLPTATDFGEVEGARHVENHSSKAA